MLHGGAACRVHACLDVACGGTCMDTSRARACVHDSVNGGREHVLSQQHMTTFARNGFRISKALHT